MMATWENSSLTGESVAMLSPAISRKRIARLNENVSWIEKLERHPMKTTVKKAKGGTRHKTLKEEKRDISRSLKSIGKKVASKLKGK